MKKIFIMLIFSFLNTLTALECSPLLQKHLNAIVKIQDGKDLVAAIQKEGPIQIIAKKTALSKEFGAFWDPDRRIIVVDTSFGCSEGSIIGSLLFELHNASVNSRFIQLNKLASAGKISKENYVKSMEYIEYVNSLNASNIANKGIKMGLFPKDAYLPTYPNFEEHFRAQKRSGHSDCFSRNFDSLRI